MVVYSVSVLVKIGHEDEFRRASKLNRQETRKEKGNLRFDILQSDEDACRFLLFEVYRSPEAAAAHKETAHYKEWRNTVAPWMAGDRVGEKFTPVAPTSDEEW